MNRFAADLTNPVSIRAKLIRLKLITVLRYALQGPVEFTSKAHTLKSTYLDILYPFFHDELNPNIINL